MPSMGNSEGSSTPVVETGSDILQTPSTHEEVLNIYGLFKDFFEWASALVGTDPEGEPEPG